MQPIRMSDKPGVITRLLGKFARVSRNEDGTTAIEFAMVAMPFFMFVFGIIGVSMHYFVMNSIEKGMDQASRMIRTGQAQTQGWTVGQFENFICNKANSSRRSMVSSDPDSPPPILAEGEDGHINCSDLQVFLQQRANWDTVAPEPCVNVDGTRRINTTNKGDPLANQTGTANEVVVVTVCYEWGFTRNIPFLRFDTNDGAMIMQSATSFRTEPFTAVSTP
jgi:TadE-like protein